MAIVLDCRQCGWSLTVKSSVSGGPLECPECGGAIRRTRTEEPATGPAPDQARYGGLRLPGQPAAGAKPAAEDAYQGLKLPSAVGASNPPADEAEDADDARPARGPYGGLRLPPNVPPRRASRAAQPRAKGVATPRIAPNATPPPNDSTPAGTTPPHQTPAPRRSTSASDTPQPRRRTPSTNRRAAISRATDSTPTGRRPAAASEPPPERASTVARPASGHSAESFTAGPPSDNSLAGERPPAHTGSELDTARTVAEHPVGDAVDHPPARHSGRWRVDVDAQPPASEQPARVERPAEAPAAARPASKKRALAEPVLAEVEAEDAEAVFATDVEVADVEVQEPSTPPGLDPGLELVDSDDDSFEPSAMAAPAGPPALLARPRRRQVPVVPLAVGGALLAACLMCGGVGWIGLTLARSVASSASERAQARAARAPTPNGAETAAPAPAASDRPSLRERAEPPSRGEPAARPARPETSEAFAAHEERVRELQERLRGELPSRPEADAEAAEDGEPVQGVQEQRLSGGGAALWGVEPDPAQLEFEYKPGRFDIHHTDLRSLVFPTTASPFVLATAGALRDEFRRVFDLRSGRAVGKALPGRLDVRAPIVLSADGRWMAGLQTGNRVGVWSFAEGEQIHEISIGRQVRNLALPGGDRMLSVTVSGFEAELAAWDLSTGDPEYTIALGRARTGMRGDPWAISHGGRYAAVAAGDDLQVYEVASGQLAGRVPLPGDDARRGANCHGLAFSPDGSELAGLFDVGGQSKLVVWDVESGELQVEHTYPTSLRLPNYSGPTLEWVPETPMLIVSGGVLVDVQSGGDVWYLPELQRPGLRMLKPFELLVLMRDGARGWAATRVDLPANEIAQAVNAVRAGGLAYDAALPPLSTANLFTAALVRVPTGASPWNVEPDGREAASVARSELLVGEEHGAVRAVQFPVEGSRVLVHKELPVTRRTGRALPRQVVLTHYDLNSGRGGDELALPEFCELMDASPSGQRALVATLERNGRFDRLDVLELQPRGHVAGWRPYENEADDDKSFVWAAMIDDDHVLTVNQSGKLICWQLPECNALYVIEQFSTPLALSPGRRYLVAEPAGSPRVFDTRSGECVGTLALPESPGTIRQATFRDDALELAALMFSDGITSLVRWNFRDGSLLDEFPIASTGRGIHRGSSKRFGRQQSMQYHGEQYLIIDQRYLVNLRTRAVAWQYSVAGQGRIASGSPDGRLWYVAPRGGFHLAAVDVPSLSVKPRADFVLLDDHLLLQPGHRLRVSVRMPNHELNRRVYDVLVERLRQRGYVIDDAAPRTLSVTASERTTDRQLVVTRSFGFGLSTSGEEISETFHEEEIVCTLELTNQSTHVVWAASTRVSSGMRAQVPPELTAGAEHNRAEMRRIAQNYARQRMRESFEQDMVGGHYIDRLIPRYILRDLDGRIGHSLLTAQGESVQ